ncbi:PLP-dependent aminotransferase family protein [Gudongella oleilytica]|uniref:aminotransferase-like domain-containing protein n=1 Tax=Gudongella oleilytica TaxID=1582259 RepID=UPI0013E8C11D|nr:PLP-dependent aminotransferase family protein [Gudongella oleilytica]
MTKFSGDDLADILRYSLDPSVISFSMGSPARELYPVDAIREIVDEVLANDSQRSLSYGSTDGWQPLKKAYLEHVAKPKGVIASEDEVVVTTGSTQGVDLLTQILIDPGDCILVESPTYLNTISVFKKYEAKLVSVKMDDEGIIISDLEEKIKLHKPKMLYTIPTFQNPSGKTLLVERRKMIADLASEYDMIVLEDDPYCDLRYRGNSVPPIKTFDKTGHVVLANSFSKTIAPGLRVGTMVGSKEIIDAIILAKGITDTNTPILAQAICSGFLDRGLLPAHLESMVPLYLERLDAMLEGIRKYFPAEIKYTVPEGGLFVWVDLPDTVNTRTLLKKAAEEYKVSYVPGSAFCVDEEDGIHSIRLNFSANNAEKIDEGLKRLGELLTKELNG